MRMLHKADKYIVSLLLLTVSVFGIVGCKGESPELKAIQQSFVSNMQLSTAHMVSQSYNDKKKSTSYQKPVYATGRARYLPKDGYTKQDVFREITQALEREGWQRTDAQVQEGYYQATQEYQYLVLETTVFNHDGEDTVRVIVTHHVRAN